MKIGFLVNDLLTEEAGFTTTRLGWEAVNQGHEVFAMGVGDHQDAFPVVSRASAFADTDHPRPSAILWPQF
jgi:hypothetical protein